MIHYYFPARLHDRLEANAVAARRMNTGNEKVLDEIMNTDASLNTLIRRQFSLIELLVVIAIIIILAGLLLPVFGQAQARAKAANCESNLKQFCVALASYRSDFEEKMPGWLSNLTELKYGVTPDLLLCPQDYSQGYDGGRPGKDATTDYQGVPGEDMYSPGDYNVGKVGGSYAMQDDFRETDDTDRNTNSMPMPRSTSVRRCSYMYEFAGVLCSWDYSQYLSKPNATWNEVKAAQLKSINPETGKVFEPHLFPAVRCFYHWGMLWGKRELVFNAAYTGQVFRSRSEWEKGTYD
ncbi:MAG: hypothetical protein D6820_14890 [Lentisphaerae bacterium]|nr:MAG: hypothetical protein D6820_14890 [Lentisphaerota bacterium]